VKLFSQWADVLSGIPQGTILGPILFIDDLPDLSVSNLQFKSVCRWQIQCFFVMVCAGMAYRHLFSLKIYFFHFS